MKEVWYQLFNESFLATKGNNAILAIADFGGELYIPKFGPNKGQYALSEPDLT